MNLIDGDEKALEEYVEGLERERDAAEDERDRALGALDLIVTECEGDDVDENTITAVHEIARAGLGSEELAQELVPKPTVEDGLRGAMTDLLEGGAYEVQFMDDHDGEGTPTLMRVCDHCGGAAEWDHPAIDSHQEGCPAIAARQLVTGEST